MSRPTLPPLHTLNLPDPSVRWPPRPLHASYFHSSPHHVQSRPYLHSRHARHPSISSSATSVSRESSPDSAFSSPTSLLPLHGTPSTSDSEGDCDPPSTPILSIAPLSTRAPAPSHPHHPPFRFRLEPCTLGEAQAIVLLPPPSAPFVPTPAFPCPKEKKERQALLFVGPAIEQFRHPQRKLAKGARIQPYRIVPSRRKDSGARTQPLRRPA